MLQPCRTQWASHPCHNQVDSNDECTLCDWLKHEVISSHRSLSTWPGRRLRGGMEYFHLRWNPSLLQMRKRGGICPMINSILSCYPLKNRLESFSLKARNKRRGDRITSRNSAISFPICVTLQLKLFAKEFQLCTSQPLNNTTNLFEDYLKSLAKSTCIVQLNASYEWHCPNWLRKNQSSNIHTLDGSRLKIGLLKQ